MAFLVAKAVGYCRHTLGFTKCSICKCAPLIFFFVLSSSCHVFLFFFAKLPFQWHVYCAFPYTNRPMYCPRHGDVSGRLRVLFLHPYAYQ